MSAAPDSLAKFPFANYLRNSSMKTTVLITAVMVCFGAIAALPLAPSQPLYAHEGMDHQPGAGDMPSHKAIQIPAGQPVPTVALKIHPDAMTGWNLEMEVTNFTFAPQRVNTKGLTTEGHAHLYVDGKKVTRLYGPWYYLESLKPGQHQLTVTLNTNGHEELTYKGKPIQATTTITVPALGK